MNEQEARHHLRRPLVFGDDGQIRAIRFMDAVSAAVEAIREAPECESCNGNGRTYKMFEGAEILDDCPGCDGVGHFVLDWPVCKEEVMKAAISRIKKERLLR